MKPIRCDRCEALAAYYVGIEHAVDDVSSEAASCWLCEAHYALWVTTPAGVCRTAIEQKPDDDLLTGQYELDVTRADDDAAEVGRWTLCAAHGKELWGISK
jgi:hypothetical protein